MTTNSTLLRLAAASIGISAAVPILAEPNPYYIGASEAYTHESNLFRVARGQPETADSYWTTSLLGGLNQPIGRQRLFADLAAHYNKYRDQDQLNNTGYDARLGADWETIENLSGKIGYTFNQALARYGADQGPALTTKNVQRSQEFFVNGQYGAVGLLSLTAGYNHRQLDYSAVEFAFEEFKQDAISLGLLYRPSGALTLGIGGRHTKGKYPFAVQSSVGGFQQDDFNRNDLDLTATWIATGESTITARLSHTNESHNVVKSRDLSAVTGAIRWDYKPTGKLSFATEYVRDTGAEAGFARIDPISAPGTVTNGSLVSDNVLFRGVWEATAKIQMQVDARYVHRNLVNTVALTSGGSSSEQGTDRLGEFKVGLNYEPIRSVLLGCSYGYERRGSNSAFSYAYRAGVASCLAQFKLQ
jgi:hypothetical protein